MRVSRMAVLAGVVVLGLLCWLAVIGVAPIAEILVTVVVLVGLVAGGNLLSPRPHGARPPSPAPPPHAGSASGHEPPAGSVDPDRP